MEVVGDCVEVGEDEPGDLFGSPVCLPAKEQDRRCVGLASREEFAEVGVAEQIAEPAEPGAAEIDTAELVATLRSHGANLPQKLLSRTLTTR